METIKRASTRATAEAEQATSLLDTARAEVRLTAERADEATAGMARAARDGVTTLDETRRMYEERVEAIKLECEARMRAAEDRSRAVEHERQRAEMSRQATCKELTRLQVPCTLVSSSRSYRQRIVDDLERCALKVTRNMYCTALHIEFGRCCPKVLPLPSPLCVGYRTNYVCEIELP